MLYYFVYFLLIAYVARVTKRALHMLQQNLYNENNRYIRWVKKNLKITVFNISLLTILVSIIILVCDNVQIRDFLLIALMEKAILWILGNSELYWEKVKGLIFPK